MAQRPSWRSGIADLRLARRGRLTAIGIMMLSMACLEVLSLSTCNIIEPNKQRALQQEKPLVLSTSLERRSLRLFETASAYDAEDDFVEDLVEDPDFAEDSFMASPLSQLQSDEEAALYRGTFSRNELWLEKATGEILSLERFPIGSLREDDVESITGLMAAWVRRRSVDAALAVEKLLKRVVDDMRARNPEVHVTTRMYTIAIDAWAKCGNNVGAERAQNIHDGMVDHYRNTADPLVAPSSISYNTVINAWCKCADSSAPDMAERMLQEMLEWDDESMAPDAVTFSTLLDTYARANPPNATQNAERLFESMDDLKVKRNVFTFSALQNVYARSCRPDAPEKAMKVLQRMLDLCAKGDVFAKPNCVNYNAVLNAYSRTHTRKSAERADEMLSKMELPVEEGGYDVEPDRLSYALTILACARCPDYSLAHRMSEKNLEKMERRAQYEAQRREEISSAAPAAVTMDIECFNVVLTAISRSGQKDAVHRTLRIVKRMEKYVKMGEEHIRPNKRSWNAILNAISRSRDRNMANKAEQIINHMFGLHARGIPNVRPDAFSFAAVLSAYQRLGSARAIQRADDVLRQMEDLYEAGELEAPPDVYHYTIVCAAWSRSNHKQAPNRCIQILNHMNERFEAGYPAVKPNVRTFNAVLDCLTRSSQEDKAEQLLYHMLALGRNGDMKAFPDSFSFNTVINAFTRSKKRDAGIRAESVLERFLEYSEDYPQLRPDVRSFTHIIAYYAQSYKEPDAPYKAEYMLNRLVSVFKSGQRHLAPNVFAITSVMDSYSKHRHPDAGECAERLLRLLMKLRDLHDASKLEVNTGVMNCVLNAWASCGGDDAGRRADILLQNMEEQYDTGNGEVKPNARSYCLVLSAWSKSGSFEKSERALEVLERMKRRHEEGKLAVRPGEHPFSLVINACAFTKSGSQEVDLKAFRIAVKVFTEMVESDHLEPGSVAYGWFIQACGRLRVSAQVKDENVERAFRRCCDQGLVNDFVLSCVRTAASDTLFKQLMSPAGANTMITDRDGAWKQRINMSNLPKEWTKRRRNPKNLKHRIKA